MWSARLLFNGAVFYSIFLRIVKGDGSNGNNSWVCVTVCRTAEEFLCLVEPLLFSQVIACFFLIIALYPRNLYITEAG
jgi:hypothetical protein